MAAKGVTAAEQRLRQVQALKLKAAGYTNQEIAEAMGLKTAGGASKMISAGMAAAAQEPADQIRRLEAYRLDRMHLRLWPDVVGEDTTPDQRAKAALAILKVMERRAKLLGLDVPVEFVLRLKGEQVDFMEGALRRILDGIAQLLIRSGHGDLVEDQWESIIGQVVVPELESLAAAAQPAS